MSSNIFCKLCYLSLLITFSLTGTTPKETNVPVTIRCGHGASDPTCVLYYFDRPKNNFLPRIPSLSAISKTETTDVVTAIRSGKGLHSGTIVIVDAPTDCDGNDKDCKRNDWRVVVMAKESSNILTYEPADITTYVDAIVGNGKQQLMFVLPISIEWIEIARATTNLSDPSRKPPVQFPPPPTPDKPTPPYCNNVLKSSAPDTDIRPCDVESRLGFMYKNPAATLYNNWTQPGASAATISFTPAIGQIPKGSLACGMPAVPGCLKPPAETLNFDMQEYPSGKWGKGYIGVPIVFEKANTATANLSSLIFGVSYDIPFAQWCPALYESGSVLGPCWKTKAKPAIDSSGTPTRSILGTITIRPPDVRFQYGPEIGAATPHDVNMVADAVVRLPFIFNTHRQPSALSIFPLGGLEGGDHLRTHLDESYPIFRKVIGFDASLRVPFVAMHSLFGDKPETIDFSWRTRYLSYNEPFTDYVSGFPETLTKQQRSYWRGSYIVPFSTLAQFKVTVQHGGLPPDFYYLGYSVNLGLTLGNPGYTEH